MAPRRREHDTHFVELVEVAELDDGLDAARGSWAVAPEPGSGTSRGQATDGSSAGRLRPGSWVSDMAVPPGPGDPSGPGDGRRSARVHRFIALGLAVLVCGGAASFLIGDVVERSRAGQVATQPGGLWSLSAEPAPVWRVSTDGQWPAAVDGQVVLVDEEGGLTALDVVTGEAGWEATLPTGRSVCGPGLLDPSGDGSPLVCVTTGRPATGSGATAPDDSIVVTVLDGAGQVLGTRPLVGGTDAAAPLAGGMVATVTHEGSDVVVRWEGALDGVVEQEQSVDVTQVPGDAVGSTGDETTAPATGGDTTAVTADARRGPLRVRAPGLDATFDASGDPRYGSDRSQAVGGGWDDGGALPGGLRVEVTRDQHSSQVEKVDVVGPDGRELFSLAGDPFVPDISDGKPPEVLVVRTPGFTAYDASSGRRLWHREEWPEVIWLQTSDVIVMESGSQLLALETRTGRDLWQRWLPTEIISAFTDGDSLLLSTGGTGHTESAELGPPDVVSLNLFDGHVEWRETFDASYREIASAQGRLFAVTSSELVRLG